MIASEPQNSIRSQLAAMWMQFGAGQPADDDDYFERGGTSLSSIEFAIAIARQFDLPDDPFLVVDHSNFGRLVARVSQMRNDVAS